MYPAQLPARRHHGVCAGSTGYRSRGRAAGYMTVRLPPTDRPATATPAETATGCKHCPPADSCKHSRVPPAETATTARHCHRPQASPLSRPPETGQTADRWPTDRRQPPDAATDAAGCNAADSPRAWRPSVRALRRQSMAYSHRRKRPRVQPSGRPSMARHSRPCQHTERM